MSICKRDRCREHLAREEGAGSWSDCHDQAGFGRPVGETEVSRALKRIGPGQEVEQSAQLRVGAGTVPRCRNDERYPAA